MPPLSDEQADKILDDVLGQVMYMGRLKRALEARDYPRLCRYPDDHRVAMRQYMRGDITISQLLTIMRPDSQGC